MITSRLLTFLAIAVGLGVTLVWSDNGKLFSDLMSEGSLAPKTEGLAPAQPSAAAVADAGTRPLNPISGLTISSIAEIVERPLFNPTRAPAPKAPEPVAEPQPVAEPAPVETPPAINPDDFTLLAVASSGTDKTVLVRTNASNEVQRLKLGQYLNGMQITDVGEREITLTHEGQTFQLKLFQKPASGGPATPPGAEPVDPAAAEGAVEETPDTTVQ